jgi:hypothetical protein
MHQYPVFALAYGAIGFVRAMMTWEKPAMKEAAERMNVARDFAQSFCPVESTLGWLMGSKAAPLNSVQMESTLIMAECSTLGAMMMLTDEKYTRLCSCLFFWCRVASLTSSFCEQLHVVRESRSEFAQRLEVV